MQFRSTVLPNSSYSYIAFIALLWLVNQLLNLLQRLVRQPFNNQYLGCCRNIYMIARRQLYLPLRAHFASRVTTSTAHCAGLATTTTAATRAESSHASRVTVTTRSVRAEAYCACICFPLVRSGAINHSDTSIKTCSAINQNCRGAKTRVNIV